MNNRGTTDECGIETKQEQYNQRIKQTNKPEIKYIKRVLHIRTASKPAMIRRSNDH
jgi:hypothetical protein